MCKGSAVYLETFISNANPYVTIAFALSNIFTFNYWTNELYVLVWSWGPSPPPQHLQQDGHVNNRNRTNLKMEAELAYQLGCD